jgi:GNAT superfamily N-acetyltransferase
MRTTADLDLARALEGAETETCRAFCEAAARVHPELVIRVMPCAGGVCTLYGPGDPLNAVKGVGLNGPVDPGEWDEVESLFRRNASAVVIDLCPLADPAFVALLCDRGYRIGSFETVTFRRLTGTDLPEPRSLSDCRITPATEFAAWGSLVASAFADGGEPVPMAVDMGRVRAALTGSYALVATFDGVPAGGAAMSVHGTVAHFAGGAVLPEFRRRGVQAALTAARLRLAMDLGSTLVKMDVLAGSASHRNATRAGFEVAYTRPQLVRAWA